LIEVVKEENFLRPLVEQIVQQILEAEMDETVGAEKSERTPNRLGYRSGYYPRTLVTRVGKLELRVPQDRQGRFRTEVFERYQRSEKALVGALAEMYIQGVSTRKVKEITEQLCGHEFSAATVSRINDQAHLEPAGFQDLEEWNPVGASGLHCHCLNPARFEPVRQLMEIFRECGECAHRFGIPVRRPGKPQRRFPLRLYRLRPHRAARSVIRLASGRFHLPLFGSGHGKITST
jgi:Transposase, Mutator family